MIPKELYDEINNLSYTLFKIAELINHKYLREKIESKAVDLIEFSFGSDDEDFLKCSGITRQLISLASNLGYVSEPNKKIILDKLYDFEYIMSSEVDVFKAEETINGIEGFLNPPVGGGNNEINIEEIELMDKDRKLDEMLMVKDNFEESELEEEEPGKNYIRQFGKNEDILLDEEDLNVDIEDEQIQSEGVEISTNKGNISKPHLIEQDRVNPTYKKDGVINPAYKQDGARRNKADNRRDEVFDKVKQGGICFLRDLTASFPNYSERTIRYDLERLIQEEKIEKIGNSGPGTFYRVLAE